MDIYHRIQKTKIVALQKFIAEHQLLKKDLLRNNDILEKYLNNFVECLDGLNWNECQQLIPGYRLELVYENQRIYLEMQDCLHRQYLRANDKIRNNYLICHFPLSMINLSLENDFHLPENDFIRIKLKEYFINFLKKEQTTGLYIYGAPGIGKTYISILLANSLVRNDYKVCFVFVPQLMSQLKQAISKATNSLASDIYKLQTCDVLFLDDLAGEPVSEWTRDEILFSILNYRMQHNLSTFFTSNYDMGNLQEYYSRNAKYKNIDIVKSIRLVERIRYLAKPVLLGGDVLRKYAQ
ncbi:ATP-binding protein [Spiroplasma endosymbiont of Eupeodes luniger]|uniref:ATP-binding protein n=1 Tax=Spiroplasma endosymbiont of Eupeodes luniger TaxID=3066300 RepID=UPI0030D0406E